jgi:hypothetical protein
VVLVHHEVAGAQFGERAQRAAAPTRAAGVEAPAWSAAAAHQAVLGEHREFQRRRDEALAKRRRDERQRARCRRRAGIRAVLEPARLQMAEVVCRPFAFAAARERDHRLVFRSQQLV